jgi:branched-chain amino acid transport system permease protein
MATFSTFVAWALIHYGLPYWIAFLAAVVISFAAGAIVQLVVMRPFEKAPALNNLIIFLALLLIFHALSGWLFGHEIKVFPSPFAENSWYSSKLLPAHSIGSIALTAVVVAALFLFLRHTSVGLAMRAAALNPASARWVGIPVSWMLALGWGLAASIGAVAGMMIAPIVFLDPNMMSGFCSTHLQAHCSAASTTRGAPRSAALLLASSRTCLEPT